MRKVFSKLLEPCGRRSTCCTSNEPCGRRRTCCTNIEPCRRRTCCTSKAKEERRSSLVGSDEPSSVDVAALPVKQGRKRKPVMPGRKAEATSVNNDKPSDTEAAAPAPNLGRKPRTVLFEDVVAPVSKHVGAPSASSQQDNSPQFCKS